LQKAKTEHILQTAIPCIAKQGKICYSESLFPYDYFQNVFNLQSAGVVMSKGKGKIMFAIGEMAVYPSHGVGRIENIEVQAIGGIDQSFYVLKILDNDMTIMIPTATSGNVGLRPIISKNEVKKVVDILKDRDIKVSAQTWNRRYRDYMDKIKTGSVFEVAVVLRDLLLLKGDKDLSYGERKMMDTAKTLLVKEISLARKVEEDKVEQQIDKIFE
jgi:CarD family transcriptional regulator